MCIFCFLSVHSDGLNFTGQERITVRLYQIVQLAILNILMLNIHLLISILRTSLGGKVLFLFLF